MDPERQERIKELFEAALKQEPEKRSSFLAQACAGDTSLRAAVVRLLTRHSRAAAHIQQVTVAKASGDAPPAFSPDQVVSGRFQVIRLIGRGGMGEVYLAHDQRMDREVALKVPPASALADTSARKRLRKEAQTLSKLNHPNIETIFEIGSQGDLEFLVVEYIPGATLSDMLAKGSLPEKEVARLGAQLANGLAAAHAQRVVHRDLKPANLRVTPNGWLKILDFGIAQWSRPERAAPAPHDTTESGRESPGAAGTLPYMSPEQLQLELADARSDIYAAGAVLYEMATGQRPFAEGAVPRLIDAILHQQLVPPRALNARVSLELERIVTKCLQKEPENRYQSAQDLEVDLRQLATPQTARPAAALSRVQRRRRYAGLSFALIVALAAILIAWGLRGWRHRVPGRVDAEPIDSLAVLPLENLSGDSQQEYFADGMTDELITDLAQISALRVISRTSVMQYKGTHKPLRAIAHELNVKAIVEGTVLRSGEHVRIAAELIDARTDSHLWARSYDRDLRDILKLQSEVARDITNEIRVKVTPQERARLAVAGPVNLEAYEAYLRGRYHWSERTEDGLELAISYFKQAIQKDPTDALAYAGIADSYNALGSNDFLSPRQAFPQAKAAALKALEMDPNLAEAHASLAFAIWNHEFDWGRVESEYRRAIELNPGYATAYHWYAGYLSGMGRHAEAIVAIKKARELDPLSSRINANVGFILYCARQYDQAIAELRKAQEMDPGGDASYRYLGLVYVQKGDYQDAIAALERNNQLLAGRGGSALDLAYAYAAAGRQQEARRILGRQMKGSKQNYVSALAIARVYAALGEKDDAFTWLQKAYEDRTIPLLKVDPTLDSLRPDPRFRALLVSMKLPP